eukprot:3208825-Pleurochrysis_carterae.AAC.3
MVGPRLRVEIRDERGRRDAGEQNKVTCEGQGTGVVLMKGVNAKVKGVNAKVKGVNAKVLFKEARVEAHKRAE